MAKLAVRSVLILAAVALVATAFTAATSFAAKPKPHHKKAKPVEVLGFSLIDRRTPKGLQHIVESGGKITSKSCRPRRLFAFVSFSKVPRGALVRWRWRHNGHLVTSETAPWEFGGRRRVVSSFIHNSLSLPRGRYQVAVKVTGKHTVIGRVTLGC